MRRLDVRSALLLLALPVLISGCAANMLHEYDYRDRTLAVVSDIPFRPSVFSGSWFDATSSGDLVRDVLRASARVVQELQAREARDRLDAAAERIDVGHVLEDNTLERAARFMGADPAPEDSDPDYLLELVVVDYGIDANSWNATAHFFIEADAALLHADSGTEIWRAEVVTRDPVGPAVLGAPSELRDFLTAAALADLSEDEMVEVLEGLADYAAGMVTDRLRDDLREARRR